MSKKKIKILITGVAGFIGSSFLESFFTRGIIDDYEIVGVDDLSNGLKTNVLEFSHPNFSFHEIDAQQYLRGMYDIPKFDYIFNFAAHGSIPKNERVPFLAGKSLEIAMECMTYCSDNNNCVLVHSSSSSVYGNYSKAGFEHLQRKESILCDVENNYALGKRATESILTLSASGIVDSFESRVKFIGLRYFNVYGPRQRRDVEHTGVVAKWFDSIERTKSIQVMGDGETRRCFTYIDDVVDVLHLCFNNEKALGQFVNVASKEQRSLNDLVGILKERLGEFTRIGYLESPTNVTSCPASLTKLTETFKGFQPEYSLEKGIDKMIEVINEHQ